MVEQNTSNIWIQVQFLDKNISRLFFGINKYFKRKVPFVGMTGWAVNSIAKAIKGSIPFLPRSYKLYTLLAYYNL